MKVSASQLQSRFRSTGRSNTGPEAEPPVVEVSDRGVTDHPTATKE
jgi:hypothetical protein